MGGDKSKVRQPFRLFAHVLGNGGERGQNDCRHLDQKYTLYRCTDLSKGFLLYKSHVEATPPMNTYIDVDVIGMRFW